MNSLFTVTLYGTLVGVLGTALGGVFGAVLLFFGKTYKKMSSRKINKNFVYSFLYEFSAGLMMAIVTFHMMPESLSEGGIFYSFSGLFLGLGFVFVFQKIINKKSKHIKEISTGLLLLFGIGLHNLPEGIAIGASFANNFSFAVSLLIIIAVHDIPEGISVFVPLYAGGMKVHKILLLVAISGVPTGIGAFIGNLAGNMGAGFNALSLSFSAGAMLYVCVGELCFEAQEMYNKKIIATGYILGLALGFLLC